MRRDPTGYGGLKTKETPINNRGLWALAIGETLVWAGLFYVFAALLLSWEQDLGWPKTDLTIAFILAVLTAAAASPFTGRIVDIGYGRWLLGLGAFFGALGLVALSFVESRTAFIAVWMLIGLSFSACLYEPCFAFVTHATGPLARPALSHASPSQRGLPPPSRFRAGLSWPKSWVGAGQCWYLRPL